MPVKQHAILGAQGAGIGALVRATPEPLKRSLSRRAFVICAKTCDQRAVRYIASCPKRLRPS